MLTVPQNINCWFWSVDGIADQVYSTAHEGFIPMTHDDFVTWKDRGGRPTKMVSEVALRDLLESHGITMA